MLCQGQISTVWLFGWTNNTLDKNWGCGNSSLRLMITNTTSKLTAKSHRFTFISSWRNSQKGLLSKIRKDWIAWKIGKDNRSLLSFINPGNDIYLGLHLFFLDNLNHNNLIIMHARFPNHPPHTGPFNNIVSHPVRRHRAQPIFTYHGKESPQNIYYEMNPYLLQIAPP
jgi:hypothetical protein